MSFNIKLFQGWKLFEHSRTITVATQNNEKDGLSNKHSSTSWKHSIITPLNGFKIVVTNEE